MATKTITKTIPVAAYIRESTAAQDLGYSPDNQERSIKKYAEDHHMAITDFYKDLVSGTEASNRDSFQRMLDDAVQKKFEVILVYHTSRFARNLTEARQYKEMLRQKLGINVISVTQHFGSDWDDPGYYLNEGINELFDGYYSKQLSFWLKTSLMEKRRQGYQRGNPPFGYHKKLLGFDKERNRPIYDKEWLPHPTEQKWLQWIFETYAAGIKSMSDIAHELNDNNVKTKTGGLFTHSTLKEILKNRIYLGVLPPGRKKLPEIPGKHPRLLSDELFTKCQEVIELRHNWTGRPVAEHRFFLLKGLIFCHHCFHRLKFAKGKTKRVFSPTMYCQTNQWTDAEGERQEHYVYACKYRREDKSCLQPTVMCKTINNQVQDVMEALIFPDDLIDKVIGCIDTLYQEKQQSPKVQDQMQELLKKKKKLTHVYTETNELSDEEYNERLNKLNKQLQKYEMLGLTAGNGKLKLEQYISLTKSYLKDFQSFWLHELPKEEQRSWIQALMKRIWIKDQNVVGIEPQEDFKPFFISLRKLTNDCPLVAPIEKRSAYADLFSIG